MAVTHRKPNAIQSAHRTDVVIGLLIAGAGLDALVNEVFSSSGSDEFVNVVVLPGFGLLLYGAAMVAATVGVVMIWAQRSKTPGPPV